MKAEINQRGSLMITPETEIEKYGLEGWCSRFLTKDAKGEICFIFEVPNKEGTISTSANMKIGIVGLRTK